MAKPPKESRPPAIRSSVSREDIRPATGRPKQQSADPPTLLLPETSMDSDLEIARPLMTSESYLEMKITAKAVEGIFQEHHGKAPLPEAQGYATLARDISRPWADGPEQSDFWDLRHAIAVVLDETPKIIVREERGLNRARLTSWRNLLQAATELREAGMRLPDRTAKPPAHKRSVKNPKHRDWEAVVNLVRHTLITAKRKHEKDKRAREAVDQDERQVRIGMGSEGPLMRIACGLLEELGFEVTTEALEQHFKRKRKNHSAGRTDFAL